jgi:hypothetical protein
MIGSLKASFQRLKDRLLYEEYGERKIILKMNTLLYNRQARKVETYQIKNCIHVSFGKKCK